MTAVYVDISSHNGVPDLRAYWNAGYRDLMMKASEGTGYYWPAMQSYARLWHSFGPDARVGYYHWLYGTLSGADQFDYFWRRVSPVFRVGDWLMDDFEDVEPSRWVSDATHLTVMRDFNTLCAQRAPIVTYTGNWYLANLPLCRAYLRTQMVVMSDYSHTPPLNPYGLNYVAQQFTDRAVVPGFAAPVDCNRWLAPLINTTPEDTLSDAEVADIKTHVDQQIAQMKADLLAALAPTVQNVIDCRGAAVEIRTIARATAVTTGNIGTTVAAIGTKVAALAATPAVPGSLDGSTFTATLHTAKDAAV